MDNNSIKKKELSVNNAYKTLFFKDGNLTETAKIFLDDLYEFSKYWEHNTIDTNKLLVLEGTRKCVSYIVENLNIKQSEILRKYKPIQSEY